MWERKYEQGRWNGLTLNILSTAIDGGKRLQVSEIPYADLPNIKVMGSAANKIDIDVVFVGNNSLNDANALLDNLNKTPRGELEHPWLGELSLVFNTYSQKISTTLGVVTLNLSFIRDANRVSTISTQTVTTTLKEQTDAVESLSTQSFVNDVDGMSISDIRSLQTDFTELVGDLTAIATQLNVPSQVLSSLNQEINSAMVAISSIANAPAQFAEQLSRTIDSVADAVQSEGNTANEAVDHSRMAQATMLDNINPSTPSAHYNIQTTVAAVKMSKDIVHLEEMPSFNLVDATTQPAITISDINRITVQLDACITDVTSVSTLESLELFDALTSLKENVSAQSNKVEKGSTPKNYIELARFQPALTIGHSTDSDEALITALNPQQHPLFIRGRVAVEVSQ